MKQKSTKAMKVPKNEKRTSIRKKITLRMLLTVFVALLISGFCSSYMNYTSTKTLLESTMSQTASLAADRVNYELKGYRNIAWEVGSVARLSNAEVAVSDKEDIIRQRVETHGFLRGGILDSDGINIFTGVDYSDREYFKQAMAGNTYVSEPLVSKVSGELTIVIAAPLWESGHPYSNVVGAVYFVPPETFLNDIVASIKVSESSGAYIINGEGTTIAHPNMDNVINQENTIQDARTDSALASLAAMEREAISGKSGFGIYSYGGVRKFLAYTPIDGTDGWAIGVNAPLRDFLDSTIFSIIVIALVTIAALAVALVITRQLAVSIGNPLTACAQRLYTMSQGDLNSPMPDVATKDEVGMLVQASASLQKDLSCIIEDIDRVMKEMSMGNFAVESSNREAYVGDYQQILLSMERLRDTMCGTLKNIRAASEQVDASSGHVAINAQSLSNGATQQSSSIQELAASVSEIDTYIQQTDEIAQRAKEKMDETGQLTVNCNERMKDMLSAMDDISQSSQEIGKIIKTIEDIAFQTNILALNAAVEAARAGEAGKGFAVVADEVRSLAGKSAEASKNTTVLIDTSTAAVKRGASLAAATAEQIQNVTDAAGIIDGLISSIADNAHKQASAVHQVTEGIGQISSVIQDNSTTAEESAASSEELSSQATVLKQQISRFRLADDYSPAGGRRGTGTPHSKG